MPLRGSLVVLTIGSMLYLLVALGIGLVISAVAKSQFVASSLAAVVSFLPAMMLSGFLFDIRSMPAFLRAVTYIVPAKYYITVTRGVLLKGVALDVLWPQAVSMIIFAFVGLSLATLAFHKRLDA